MFYCDEERLFSLTQAHGKYLKKTRFLSGELIFEDHFETLNLDIWKREFSNGAHINEFQLFCDHEENSYVKNGILHLAPTFYNETNDEKSATMKHFRKTKKFAQNKFHPIRSARLDTRNSFSFLYGTVEFRAKISLGDWLWPALWLMPKDSVYGSWPLSGEIDLLESRGNKNCTNSAGEYVGAEVASSTMHWGPISSLDKWRLTTVSKINDSCFGTDFHSYRVTWTPKSFTFSIDNEETGCISLPQEGFWKFGQFPKNLKNPWENGTLAAPFDQEFYLIINLAVGGTTYFSDSNFYEGGKPWNNSSPFAAEEFWQKRDQWLPTWNLPSEDSHLLIDYVKVWAL